MAREDVVNPSNLAHGGIERVNRRSGHSKGNIDTFFLQNVNSGFCCGHASHGVSSEVRLFLYSRRSSSRRMKRLCTVGKG